MTIDDIHDSQTFARLREFSRKEHTEECFDFLATVVEYKKKPTILGADSIMRNFIAVCT